MNWKNKKHGLLSLCLMALVGCSSNERTHYQTVKPNPLLCPTHDSCQMPSVEVKTNADLARSLDKALTQIELCQIQLNALSECITEYNKHLKGE